MLQHSSSSCPVTKSIHHDLQQVNITSMGIQVHSSKTSSGPATNLRLTEKGRHILLGNLVFYAQPLQLYQGDADTAYMHAHGKHTMVKTAHTGRQQMARDIYHSTSTQQETPRPVAVTSGKTSVVHQANVNVKEEEHIVRKLQLKTQLP